MKINGKMLTDYSEAFNSNDRKAKRALFYNMHLMYEGGGRPLIEQKIRAEFKVQDTITELSGRLVTLNFMKKIIDKSAGVYTEAPSRMVVDENETDTELLELYEDATRINMIQKESNRHIKMYKRCLKKFYADEKGRPRILVKPAYAYEVFNIANTDPVSPDMVIELIHDDAKPEDQILHWWSDESFWITDGKGAVKTEDMTRLLNGGINEIGALPFEYRVTSTTNIDPIVEDDLYHMCISLPIVLTDLFFALKYQCWSIIYTINAAAKSLEMSPATILELTGDAGQTPSLGQIKPQVDSDKVINLVEFVINLMLSSKGLSNGTISGRGTAKDVVSGASKMMDSAEIVEDKKDQQDLFLIDETDCWYKISKNMVPYWRKKTLLSLEFNKDFSVAFKVATVFKEPKAMISAKERTELGVIKIENGLMTRKRFIQEDNPDYTETMVDAYIAEIDEEKAKANPDKKDDLDKDKKDEKVL
jgi:hypothetical protein